MLLFYVYVSITGSRLARTTPPPRLPLLLLSLYCPHATATTLAAPAGAGVARFPTAVSLPRKSGGSVSALPEAWSAFYVLQRIRRSLTLRPADSLNLLWRPVDIGVLQSISLPP